jgi:AcrR family transcriptional regulator
MDVSSTPSRILNAAERLFVQRGFAGTSLRAITTEAKVNLASVNYHFGSKEALIEAVFSRRLELLNRKRLVNLAALEKEAGVCPLQLESVLEAFIRPSPRLEHEPESGGEQFLKLLGHAYAEPSQHLSVFLRRHHHETLIRFQDALQQCLPHLSTDELRWRIHFMLGATGYALAGQNALHLISLTAGGGPEGVPGIIQRLIAFIAAGFRAPETEPPDRVAQ